jgi:hypothetical protein
MLTIVGRCTICTSNYCYHLGVPVASEPPKKVTRRGGRMQTLQAEINTSFATGVFDKDAFVDYAIHATEDYTTPTADERREFLEDFLNLGADPLLIMEACAIKHSKYLLNAQACCFQKNKCDLYLCVCIRACNTRERLSFLITFCIHTFLRHGSACVDFMFRHVSALMLASAIFRRCSLIVIALLCVHYASTHNRGVVAATTRRRASSTATSAGASCSGHARSPKWRRHATRSSAICEPTQPRRRMWRAAAAFSNGWHAIFHMGNFVYGKLYWRSHVYGEFMLSIGGSWPSRLQARFKELGVGGSSIVYCKK